MTQVSNNFSGGTDGTTVTSGNSGGASGTAFDGTDLPAGAVLAYTNTQAYGGPLSMRVGTRATGGLCGANWTTALGTLGDHYGRLFFRTDVLPATNERIIYALDSTLANQSFTVRLLFNGTLDLHNGADSTIATSTTVLSANQWYRLEWFNHQNSSTGYVTLRIYSNPAATVANFTEELNAGGGTATWNNPAVGYMEFPSTTGGTNWPSATQYVYYSGIVVGAPTTWVGPYPLPQVPHMYLARTSANF